MSNTLKTEENVFTKKRKVTARLVIILVTILLGIYFQSSGLMVIASAYLIFYLSKKLINTKFTILFENAIMIFLVASNLLGGDAGFYDTIPWWDEMLHFAYGLAFTFIGYRLIAFFFQKRNIKNDKWIMLGFSFCFAIAFTAIWEIYEYAMDFWLGDYFLENGITLMQADLGSNENQINDTMNDIILAVASSIIMNLILLGYLSRGWFDKIANYNFIRTDK